MHFPVAAQNGVSRDRGFDATHVVMMMHAHHHHDVCGERTKAGLELKYLSSSPTFRNTAASTTDPAVLHSTCASGSQLCSGQQGNLLISPIIGISMVVYRVRSI